MQGTEFMLRPMTMLDADNMLKWKNYEETRKFAIVGRQPIKREDHILWLRDNIRYFQIIDEHKGAVRVQNGEVSIWIDREYRGLGLAEDVLRKVSKKGYAAKIVDGNIASVRTFIRAGYLPSTYILSDDVGYYVFVKE